jgi:hypothetical protein
MTAVIATFSRQVRVKLFCATSRGSKASQRDFGTTPFQNSRRAKYQRLESVWSFAEQAGI